MTAEEGARVSGTFRAAGDLAGLILLSVLMVGCNLAGTRSISGSRALYNDMICRTGSEQALQMIVRMRYDEPFTLLNVASITATIKTSARAGAQFGLGPDESFAGNLVPLWAEMGYEEAPTVVYQPLQGAARIREFCSPLSVETVMLLARAPRSGVPILPLLIERINDLRNPAAGTDEDRAGFDRAFALIESLRAAGVAQWVVREGPDGGIQLVIQGYKRDHNEEVRELIELLNLSDVSADGKDIVLPVGQAVGVGPRKHIDVQTRSISDLLSLAVDGVDVPQEHLDRGIAQARNQSEGLQGWIRIHCSADRPGYALAAIQHHGWWFYVDSRDAESKAGFVRLLMLLDMAIQGEVKVQMAPLLTVPVGSR